MYQTFYGCSSFELRKPKCSAKAQMKSSRERLLDFMNEPIDFEKMKREKESQIRKIEKEIEELEEKKIHSLKQSIKEAEIMFVELGWYVQTLKEDIVARSGCDSRQRIAFFINEKIYVCCTVGPEVNSTLRVSPKLHLAIHKMQECLGWFDE